MGRYRIIEGIVRIRSGRGLLGHPSYLFLIKTDAFYGKGRKGKKQTKKCRQKPDRPDFFGAELDGSRIEEGGREKPHLSNILAILIFTIIFY